MKYSRLLATAALAACLGVPAVASAQFNNGVAGSSGYGIFGGGTNGASGSFGRGGAMSAGGFGQGLGTAGGIGRTSAVGVGSGATVSPYLNMLRPGNAAVNYISLVRPQLQQNAINTQNSNNFQQFQQTDRLLLEQQQARQTFDPTLANADLGSRRPEPVAQSEARRRASEPAESDLRDWSNNTRSQDPQTKDARKREASLRQQQELKALEKELAASADTNKQATGTGAPADRIPGTPYGYRPINHYFPTQGGTNRLGGNR